MITGGGCVLGTAGFGDFSGHDFADHLPHLASQKVSKDTVGFRRWNLAKGCNEINFVHGWSPRRLQLTKIEKFQEGRSCLPGDHLSSFNKQRVASQ